MCFIVAKETYLINKYRKQNTFYRHRLLNSQDSDWMEAMLELCNRLMQRIIKELQRQHKE